MDVPQDNTPAVLVSEKVIRQRAACKAWYEKNRKTGRPVGAPPKPHIFVDGIEGKNCGHCHAWKPMDAYHRCKRWHDGHVNTCRDCVNLLGKVNRDRNLDERNAKQRANYASKKAHYRAWAATPEQKDKARQRQQRRMEANPEAERAKMRLRKNRQYQRDGARLRAEDKRRRTTNPAYILYAQRYRSQPKIRLHSNMSRGVRASLKKGKNGFKWETLVGYTREDLIRHLESLFVEGMAWDNYGAWEIDHIRPLSTFRFESYEDPAFLACWALTNLQPLWRSANRSKWAHYHACVEDDAPREIGT